MTTPILFAQAAETAAENALNIATGDLIRAGILLLIGIPCVLICTRIAANLIKRRHSAQAVFITRKIVSYTCWVLLAACILATLNINLTAILGAAGIGAVAIGFAAQTSLSNLISGLFLIVEKPFAVGDTIRVGSTIGTVQSIDLLSVKLNTPDNLFIRIPNENLVKTECVTITRNKVRRLDIKVGVAYKENVQRVLQILAEVVAANPLALKEPAPLITATDYGDSSINLLVGAWCNSEHFLALRNELIHQIKERFDREGIEIPFPYMTLCTAQGALPFPVSIEKQNADKA